MKYTVPLKSPHYWLRGARTQTRPISEVTSLLLIEEVVIIGPGFLAGNLTGGEAV